MFEGLIDAMDETHAQVSHAQRELLSLIAQADRRESWRDSGARDLAHFLAMRYGISQWKAHRWIAAAHALEGLPRLSRAFARGDLGIDKVVELTRFASSETEGHLISWARDVSCMTIRHRGDLATRASTEEVVETERARSLSWWYCDEGRRFGLEAELPAAQGAIVARMLERVAGGISAMPDEQDASFAPARREVEDGPVLHPETVRRLLCNGRIQTVVEDEGGNVLGLGRLTREPSAWMVRQVRYRDRGCRFPGCGTRAFTEVHHVVFWRHGGRTDLDNLVLICSSHHRLVHELGWSVDRDADGTFRWFRSDGTRYRAGPSPGVSACAEDDDNDGEQQLLAATG